MSYNGEVYNFRALRTDLQRAGVSFRSRTDTEVVLEGYARWGDACFRKLNGMFAAAIWDREDQSLCLARDRFGIKPLFYAVAGKNVVFGSEIKAILASGQIDPKADLTALAEYIWYGVCLARHTAFEGVREVEPGTSVTFRDEDFASRRFWSLDELNPTSPSPGKAVATVYDLLEDAVSSHLVSDVPIGVFLSGGLDSSTVTAIASQHVEGSLDTYSVGFDFDEGEGELPKARIVAQHVGSNHHELHVSGTDLPDVVERLVQSHDVPFGDAANIPLYLLCEQLNGSPKVILQGDGADEIFGGYRRYRVLQWEWFWRFLARAAPLLRWTPKTDARRRLLRVLEAMSEPERAIRLALFLTPERKRRSPLDILARPLRKEMRTADPFHAYRVRDQRFSKLDTVQAMLYTDLEILLPSQFLEKVDRSTMAHGVESRVPFLDNSLVEYLLSVPSSLKVRGGRSKWLLRNAMRSRLPRRIVEGRKRGFGVPFRQWLKRPLNDYLRSHLLAPCMDDIFDKEVVEKRLAQNDAGEEDHGPVLWKALNLAVWYSRYIA